MWYFFSTIFPPPPLTRGGGVGGGTWRAKPPRATQKEAFPASRAMSVSCPGPYAPPLHAVAPPLSESLTSRLFASIYLEVAPGPVWLNLAPGPTTLVGVLFPRQATPPPPEEGEEGASNNLRIDPVREPLSGYGRS